MTMIRDFHRLVGTVQRNCDIADARHARDMTLCTYLLEMREFYRWEHEMALDAMPPRDAVGRWLSEREARWADLEEAPLEPLEVAGRHYDPFDVAAVNDALLPHGLLYGGGLGRFRKPHFFLAELAARGAREGFPVLEAGCEYARDIGAPPAAFQAGVIVLRHDAWRRWLWGRIEVWGTRAPDGPLAEALRCYGHAGDAAATVARMAEAEAGTLLLHEVGEGRAERLLGPAWGEMVLALQGRRAELLARAVRDNLADCLSTLPALLEQGRDASLHFHFAHFEGVRAALFPLAMAGWRAWRDSGDPAPLREAVAAGRRHWEGAARRLLALHAAPGGGEAALDTLLETPGDLVLGTGCCTVAME
ncbi:MAG: hypothetical protein HY778_12390 [Betaproteobacteria bacterium]|nr:hypothetical protein [Betaproteobacteria bacterium]